MKSEPSGTPRSLDELFALANAMEREAAGRYTQLAEHMRSNKKHSLAVIFDQLAEAARKQGDNVASWSFSHLGQSPNPAPLRFDAPETFDPQTVLEITTSQLMTPYRALAIAVQNEQRAFAFWSYVAGFADDPEIKKTAEAMAREELGHVITLRKKRRRAYHDELNREGRGRHRPASAASAIDAAVLERHLAEYLAALELRVDGASVHRAKEFLQETKNILGQAAGIGEFSADLLQADAVTIAEALVDAYLDGAESTAEPRRLELLQTLAERAISRLAWLRALA